MGEADKGRDEVLYGRGSRQNLPTKNREARQTETRQAETRQAEIRQTRENAEYYGRGSRTKASPLAKSAIPASQTQRNFANDFSATILKHARKEPASTQPSSTQPSSTQPSSTQPEKTEEETRFLPWALPSALALILGIIAAHAALPWWVLPIWLLILALTFFVIPKSYRLSLGLALLCIPLGYGRMALWQQQSNPFTPYLGQTLQVVGSSDGRYLRVQQIDGVKVRSARVVLAPKDSVQAGQVTLKGDFGLPRNKRNPGGFDYRAWLWRRGVKAQFYVQEVLEHQPRKNLSLLERAQRGVVAGLSERSAGLMQAMTLGIRDDLGDLRDSFAEAGMAHILALSGLHVGVLALALGWLLLPLGRTRHLIIMVIISIFVVLVGASPSVLRAGLMVNVALLSLYFGAGRIDAWAALGLSALGILLFNPSYLLDLSFQLSYLAVAGILLFANPLSRLFLGENVLELKWYYPKQFIVVSMIVSLSAQLLSLPLVLSTFNNLPVFSPVINIVAVPLAMVLVPLGFAAAVIGLFALPLAQTLNLIASEWLARFLMALADVGAALPSLHWGEIAALGYIYYAIALLSLALWLHKLLSLNQSLLVIIACVAGSLITSNDRVPEVVFLDVGQGDSTLIRLANRTEILMDGGGTPFSDFDIGAQVIVPALRALDVDELEVVIASHPDTDHIEGLIGVLERIPTQLLLIGHPVEGKPVFDDLMAVAARKNIPVRQVRRGQRLVLPEATLEILNPPQQPYEENNDNSIVLVMTIHATGKRILLLGDSSFTVERDIAFPEVDIILAGHHGSPSSTSAELLTAARPEQAVLSYGRNNYGHPAPEVRARLEAIGADIFSTFEHGAIRLSLQ